MGASKGQSIEELLRGAAGLKVLKDSRLNDTGLPVRPPRTATPTGDVSIRVWRPDRARCSSRYLRALAMTSSAWAANMVRTSSSSRPTLLRPVKADAVAPERREAWVAQRVEEGVDVLVCHPWLVQTDLDLVDFPTICWYETEFSVFQSTRKAALLVGCELAVASLRWVP